MPKIKSIDYSLDDIDEEEEKDEEMGDRSVLYPAAEINRDDVMVASAASESSLLDDSKREKSDFDTFRTAVDVVEDDEAEEPSIFMPYRNSIYSNNSSTATPIISNVKSRTKNWNQKSKTVAPTPSSGTRSSVDVPLDHKKDIATDAQVRKRISKRWCWIVTGALFLAAAVALGGYCGAGMCSGRDMDVKVGGGGGGGTGGSNTTNVSIEDIINNNISLLGDSSIKLDDDTPEGAALQWLAEKDTFDYDYSGIQDGTNQTSTFRLRQRYALALLLLQSVGIPESVISNECDWPGVVMCEDPGSGMGQQKNVVKLNLSNSSFVGSIPPDVGLLTNLKEFSVSQNPSLLGTLPGTIGMWSNLEMFGASSTSLSGSLPESIGNWSKLQKFHIDAISPADLQALFNGTGPQGFNGTLPRSIGNWTEIREVRMYGNSFDGSLPPSVISWTDLMLLSIGGNAFTGSLPQGIGAWKKLEYFILDLDVSLFLDGPLVRNDTLRQRQNHFTGLLPAAIANWSKIVDFSVYNNTFSGTLPTGLENWTNLLFLNLAENDFSGTLPQVNLWPKIVVADIHSNNFSGTFPEYLAAWDQVVWAVFDENNFTGPATFDCTDGKLGEFVGIFSSPQNWQSVKNHPFHPLLMSALSESDEKVITVDDKAECSCCTLL